MPSRLSVDVKSAARATALLDGLTSTPTLSAAVRPSTLMSMYFVYPGTLESVFQPVIGMENETNVARSAFSPCISSSAAAAADATLAVALLDWDAALRSCSKVVSALLKEVTSHKKTQGAAVNILRRPFTHEISEAYSP